MKKFELPEQPQKRNTSNDFTVAREAIANLDKFDYAWKTYSHKLEKRFTAAIKYIEELERENQRLRAENIAVKTLVEDAKKQQPEIPEVPQFVADWYEECAPIPVETCIFDFIISYPKQNKDELPEFEKWFMKNDNSIEILMDMKRFGYTVAKEKRFYLKHIDFCKRDKDYDWYMIKHSDGPLNHLRVEKETLPPTVDTYFTQQEIDSMAAESYKQIEVGDD